MATKYFALLTNIGAAKLANATALGAQVEITQMAVGDGNGALPTPNPAQTALVHELRRAQLNMLTVDPVNTNQIIAEQVIPEDAGGWWIREIGLFDKDGDMIAVANCAETYKPQLQEGSGRVQVIRVILIVSSTEAVTLKIDPSVVLATRKYVDDAVIEVKAYADDVMKKHVAAANPHKQYPLIANALKEMVDAGLVNQVLQNLGLVDLAKTSENNTFTGDQKFTGGVSLPANTAYKGIGLQAWFDDKQKEDATLTALSGKDVAGLLSYLGLTSAAKTDAQNTFTQKQTFSGSVALPSDTTLNGTGLEYLFDSKLDASKALGMGQTWVDVTASRTAGVTYTNTTTRPICVSIPETADGQRGLYVGGVLTAFARGADSDSTLFAIVPPGAQYIFSGAFSSWSELR